MSAKVANPPPGYPYKITGDNQAEEALWEIEERYRMFLDALPDGVVVHSQGRILYANPAGAKISGAASPAELIGKLVLEFVHPDFLKTALSHIEQSMAGEPDPIDEEKFIRLDGKIIDVQVSTFPVSYFDKTSVLMVYADITERKRTEAGLEERTIMRALIDIMPDHIYAKDAEGRFTLGNIALARHMGATTPDELIGKSDFDFYPPDLAAQFHADEQALLQSGQSLLNHEEPTRDLAGRPKWTSTTKVLLSDTRGMNIGLVGIGRDITDRKRAEQALLQSDAELNALFAGMTDVVIIFDIDGRYIKIAPTNPGNLFRPANEMLGKTLHEVLPKEPADAILTLIRLSIRNDQVANGEYTLRINGKETTFSVSASRLSETTAIVVAHDITNRKRAEEQIRILSLTDELTGLYNRRGFTLLAEQEMKLAHRSKRSMLLFFGDVDNLKTINDTHGHAQGDLALHEISAILKKSFREADIVARIGGDEFVILAVDVSLESADIITNRIQSSLDKRNQPGDRPYQLVLSLGIAHYDPEAPSTINELIAQADGQMYLQKQEKRKQNH